MTPVLLLLLLGSQVQAPAGTRDGPGQIELEATHAVEGDSVSRVERRWAARLERDPEDWAATFGLASLARLTYDYGRADSIYDRLRNVGAAAALPYAAAAGVGLGRALHLRGQNAAADSALEQAVRFAALARRPELEGDALLALASVRARTKGADVARSLIERAGRLIPEHDLSLRALLQCSRAVNLQMTGRSGGERDAREGVALARRAGNGRLAAGCQRLLAVFIVDRGQPDSGLAMFGDALDRLAALGDRATLATGLQWRGYYYLAAYEYGAARQDLLRAVEEARATQARSPEAWALVNLCHLATWAGDLAAAVEYGDRARVLLEEQQDLWGLGTLLGIQGSQAYSSGERESARRLIEQGLADAVRIGYPPPIVALRVGLASLAIDDHDLDAGERHLSQARDVARTHGLSAWDQGLAYHFARLAVERGEFAAAEQALRTGLAGMGSPAAAYQWRARLADVLIRQGRAPAAELELGRAVAALDSVRAGLADRALRVAVLQSLRDVQDPNLGIPRVLAGLVAAGRTESGFELAGRRKAQSLLGQMVLRESFNRRGSGSNTPLDSLQGFARAVGWRDVAGALPDERTALLEYVTGSDGAPTTLFMVTRTGITGRLLPPFDSLESHVRRFTTMVEAGEDPSHIARRLGEALLAPAIAGLGPSVDRLVIVPDAGLHRLPFDALLLDGGRAVVDHYSVSVVPSAGVAVRLWRRVPRSGAVNLLVFGDPLFEQETEPRGETLVYGTAFAANGGLTRLRASDGEARAVARYATGATEVRLRERASEAYLKRTSLEGFRVIHFAAHALVDEQATTRTALALAPGEGEDGFVTPGDLAVLGLDADLVVLSACRTAGGVFVRGEGVEGLTAPLLQAGARAVVASLWQVGDRSAATFVGRFYRNLAGGQSAGDALAAARREARRRGEPAADWAAFVLVGDGSVRIPLREPPNVAWLWAGLAALALGMGYGAAIWRGRTGDRTRSPVTSTASTHHR